MKFSSATLAACFAISPGFAFAGIEVCETETQRIIDKGVNVYVDILAIPIQVDSETRADVILRKLALKLRPGFESKCVDKSPMPNMENFSRQAALTVGIIDAAGNRYVGAFDSSGERSYTTYPEFGRHIRGSILAHTSVVAGMLKTVGFETFESYRSGSFAEFLPSDIELSGKPITNQMLLGSSYLNGKLYQLMVSSVTASIAQ